MADDGINISTSLSHKIIKISVSAISPIYCLAAASTMDANGFQGFKFVDSSLKLFCFVFSLTVLTILPLWVWDSCSGSLAAILFTTCIFMMEYGNLLSFDEHFF